MPANEARPYDFTSLDDMYLSADEYDDIANFVCNEVRDLEEKAWSTHDRQSLDDPEEYLRSYVIAEWRTFELEYAERAATKRGRVLPFRQEIVLDVILCSGEIDEDFLVFTARYNREELLRKISEASAPWLAKYNVHLKYDSEVEFKPSEWKIFIDANVN